MTKANITMGDEGAVSVCPKAIGKQTAKELVQYMYAPQQVVTKMIALPNEQWCSGANYDYIAASEGSEYSKILLIVHADTVWRNEIIHVQEHGGALYTAPPSSGKILCGIGADDRTGCWIAEKLHKKYGLPVLISHNEETGDSGTHVFCEDAKGWLDSMELLLSADRRGCGYVTYGYDNTEIDEFMASINRPKENGSFSSISVVASHTGLASVNIGTGYYHEHTIQEYQDIAQAELALEDLGKVIENFKGKYMKATTDRLGSTYNAWGGLGDYDNPYIDHYTIDSNVDDWGQEYGYAHDYTKTVRTPKRKDSIADYIDNMLEERFEHLTDYIRDLEDRIEQLEEYLMSHYEHNC